MQELDLAFVGGAVFAADGDEPINTDVGVRDGRIAAIGTADVAAAIGAGTRVIELGDRMLMPGFIDAHVHPIEGGVERLNCDLSGGWTREDYLTTVRNYVEANPEREWIVGGGWQQAAFPGGAPSASDLDEICPDRPVIISNRDHHSAWVNTLVLRMIGIDANTPDPVDGRIERDAAGNPTGTLHEGARMLALRLAPQETRESMYLGLMAAQDYLHSCGITGWQDALIGDYGNHSSQFVHVYREAIERNELRARVNGAIWWQRERGAEQIAEIEALRAEYQHELFRVTTVKIMQDGVAENQTAAMIDPYVVPGCACAGTDTGLSFVDPELLRGYVSAIDRAGLQVHFHAIGDRGVRESLDAVAQARAENGAGGATHHIAHLQIVHPDDVARFAELDVAANVQALWASNDPQMVELNAPIIGAERHDWQYPFASLERAGATIVAGSDWPVTSPDPWLGLHVAVNRQHPAGHPDHHPEVFVPAERLSLGRALRAYTSGAAAINGRAEETGTIRVGAWADLVLLTRNPFAGPASEIWATAAAETFFAGETVYRAASA